MKKSFILLLLSCNIYIANAQQNYFIYLQTDNKQTFSVRINNKILSSSSSGYLVLSKLINGNQSFIVEFPKNEWPKQNFNINVDNADAGYFLKNFNEQGWGLFNMQNMDIVMNGTNPSKQKPKTAPNDDEFEKALARASNNDLPAKKEEPKKTISESEIPVVKVATEKVDRTPVAIVNNEPEKEEIKTITNVDPKKVEPIIEKQAEKIENPKLVLIEPTNVVINQDLESKAIIDNYKNTKITKLNTYNDDDGVTITYKIKTEVGSEIVPIFIEKDRSVFIEEEKPTVKVASNKADRAPIDLKKEPQEKLEQKIEEIKNSEKDEPKVSAVEPIKETKKEVEDKPIEPRVKMEEPKKVSEETKPIVLKNSDCKEEATKDDFLKTRKKMVAEDSDDAMVEVASKMFKQKCYSVEQIKILSTLFLNDNGKYKLFDAAYPYTFDTNNYASLENELKEAYYIKRFKAMLDR